MRNNAPVEHCVAEAFILHREIVLTMKQNFTLRVSHDLSHEYCAMKNNRLPSLGVKPQYIADDMCKRQQYIAGSLPMWQPLSFYSSSRNT